MTPQKIKVRDWFPVQTEQISCLIHSYEIALADKKSYIDSLTLVETR